MVWDGARLLLRCDQPGLDVLDIGGGTGGFAVRVAGLGHRVTVVDPSPDALAALARRAREDGVEVAGLQGDLGSLLDLVGPAGADVVLCHGVLEVVDDPAGAWPRSARCSAPAAGSRCWSPSGTPPCSPAPWPATSPRRWRSSTTPTADRAARGRRAPVHRRRAHRAARRRRLRVGSVHGIRVFADLVPGALLDLEPGTTAALLELERAVSERPEYLPLATQLHCSLRR